jgi:hypothetical protein
MNTLWLAALLCLPLGASAITRTDVLECGVSDGSKFVLRSKYKWFGLPVPVGPSSRESGRTGWKVSYSDKAGKVTAVDAGVDYVGELPKSLAEACAYFGMKQGVALGPFTLRRADGSWVSPQSLPLKRLDVTVDGTTGDAMAQQAMQQAGIVSVPFNFGMIHRVGNRMVFEKPLHRSVGYMFKTPISAVYQSWSVDDGKTWSEAKVTTDAQIFELGRGWIEQSFIARPLRLNGDRL